MLRQTILLIWVEFGSSVLFFDVASLYRKARLIGTQVQREEMKHISSYIKKWFLQQMLERDTVNKSRRMRINYLPEWDALSWNTF